MNSNENKNDKEKKIIEKYRKIQTLNSLSTIIAIFLIPFFFIGMYISKFNKLLNLKLLSIPTLILIIITGIFSIMTRICPNCKAYLGKYNIFPSRCPNCKIRLR